MKKIKLSFLLPIILLSACATTEVKQGQNNAPSMNDAQLKALLVGKTMVGSNWTVVLNTDGSAIATSTDSNDTGIYTIQNNIYCSKWTTWGSGNKRCWSISKRTKGYYGKTVSGGGDSFKFTVN